MVVQKFVKLWLAVSLGVLDVCLMELKYERDFSKRVRHDIILR